MHHTAPLENLWASWFGCSERSSHRKLFGAILSVCSGVASSVGSSPTVIYPQHLLSAPPDPSPCLRPFSLHITYHLLTYQSTYLFIMFIVYCHPRPHRQSVTSPRAGIFVSMFMGEHMPRTVPGMW